MSDKEIIQVLDRLMRECDIRDPARKNGYLSALLDVRNFITGASITENVRAALREEITS